jgi:Ca2+-binding EF-hand superfamily protein
MDQIKLPGVPAVAIDIVMRLVDKIIKHRVQLSQYWEDLVAKSPALNEEPGSLISKKDWAKGLEKVLRMQVPWLELLELLPGATKAVNSKGQIDHKVFLDTLNPSKYIKKAMGSVIEGLDESIEMLMGVIYQNRFDLESAFRWLDQAGTGVITIADFMLGIKSLASMNLLTVEEAEAPFMENEVIDALAKLIDSDEDGLIAYEQFFESLQGLVLEDVVKHNASKLGK